MNTPIIIASLSFITKYETVTKLAIWIFNKLSSLRYSDRKVRVAIMNDDVEFLRFLTKNFNCERSIRRFLKFAADKRFNVKEELIDVIVNTRIVLKNHFKEEILLWGCLKGFTNLVRVMLDQGANYDYRSLNIAIKNKHTETIKCLINHDRNSSFDHVVYDAAIKGDIETIKTLAELNAKIHSYDQAYMCAFYPCVKEFLEDKITKKLDFKDYEEFLDRIAKGDKDFVDSFYDANIGDGIAIMYATGIDMIKFLVSKGVNIHFKKDMVFETYCIENNLEVAKYLLDQGANIHARGDEPFKIACRCCHIDIIKLLVDYGIDVNLQEGIGLLLICININENIIRTFDFLVENGAIITYRHLKKALLSNNFDLVDHMINKYGLELHPKLLISACYNYKTSVVEYLISKNIDIHYNNDQALRVSCKPNDYNMRIIELLVENGANIRVNNDEPIKSMCKSTMFDAEDIEYMMDHGAKLIVDDDEVFLSTLDVEYNNAFEKMKLLVENGANIHINDEEPLFHGAYYGFVELVSFALEHGADVHARNDTILTVANQHRNEQVIDMITKAINRDI